MGIASHPYTYKALFRKFIVTNLTPNKLIKKSSERGLKLLARDLQSLADETAVDKYLST
jgi:hypothetical protein